MLELTAAYAPFFNGGFRVVPFAVEPQDTPEPVIRPEHAAMMASMMASVVSRGTGKAAAVPGRAVAGKGCTRSPGAVSGHRRGILRTAAAGPRMNAGCEHLAAGRC